jgi:mannose-1-phosphate guanylyltransferase
MRAAKGIPRTRNFFITLSGYRHRHRLSSGVVEDPYAIGVLFARSIGGVAGGPSSSTMVALAHPSLCWAIVLAGGDGTRLQTLTRRIVGDSRPKQFCRIFGGKTLLRQTRDRIDALFRRDRTLLVVTRTHAAFYADDLSDTDDAHTLVQPQNRGTGVAIIVALLRILQTEPDAIVAFFPSDHYYSNDDAFQHAVTSGVQFARTYSRSIILLGEEAHAPEVDYGWIEPGHAIVGAPATQLFRVNRFWEKPSLVQAQTLWHSRCLWNTFVTIGKAGAFLDLLSAQIPDVLRQLSVALTADDLDAAYREIHPVDFSREVLVPRPDRLLVLRDVASGWADLGNPSRVVDTLVRNRIETDWLNEVLVSPHG